MKKIRIILSLLIMMFAFSLVCLNTKIDAAGAESTVYDESLGDEAKVDYDLSRIHVGENKISSFPVTTKSVYGCTIEWSVDEAYKNVLDASYVKETGYILLTRPESLENNETEVKAKLKLTVSKGEVSKTKEFDIVVPVGKTITPKITITFNEDGVDPYQNVSAGTNKVLPTPTKDGYIFKGWYEENDTNYEGRCYTTTLGILKDITLSAKWEKATLTDLSVKSNPKTEYTALQTFDSTGLVLTATYSDGSTKEVSEGYDVNKTVIHGNDTEVTISYEGKDVSVAITVNKITMTGVEYNPDTVTYNGSEQYIEVTGTLPEWLEVTYDKKVNAGEHEVSARFNLKDGYSSVDYEVPGDLSTTLTIEKATPVVTVTFNGTYFVGSSAPEFVEGTNYTATFNGENVSGTMKWKVEEGVTLRLSETNELEYIFTPTSSNFKEVTSTVTINATNATLERIEISEGYRTTYNALETFDPGTAEITFYYSNESSETKYLKDVEYTVIYCKNEAKYFDLNKSNLEPSTVMINYSYKIGEDVYNVSDEISGLTINPLTYDLSSFSASDQTVTFDGRKHIIEENFEGENLEISQIIKLQGSEDECEGGATNVGVYDVTISFLSKDANYESPADQNYTLTIEAKSIEDENVIVDSVASQVVNSKDFDEVTPDLTIKYNVSENEVLSLVKNTDYTVVYSNNKSISSGTSVTATATITGQGNYKGTKTIEFTIELSEELKKELKFNEDVEKFKEIYGNRVDTDETASVCLSLPNGSTVEWTPESTAVKIDEEGNISVTRTENIQYIMVKATITDGTHNTDIDVEFSISELHKLATVMTKTDLEALKESGNAVQIIIGSAGGKAVAGGLNKSDKVLLSINSVIKNGYISSYGVEACVYTLQYDKSAECWYLSDGNGNYLYATAVKKLDVRDEDEKSLAQWDISINDDNKCTILYMNNNNYGRILCNVNSSRFTTYTSGTNVSMLLPEIYLYNSNAKVCSVSFNSNGGTAVSSQYVGKGGTISEPTIPTKDDHTFDGWYLDSACTTKFEFKNCIIENTTLYAKWEEKSDEGGSTTTESWKLVTDVSHLSVGDQIVIVANDSNVALSTTQNTNNRGQESISKNDDSKTVTINENVQILTLEAGSKDNTFAFNTGSGYLYAASSGSNHLKTETTMSANSSWSISITSAGVATIKAQGTNANNWIRYNPSAKIFSCYVSGQQDICIYKLTVA